MKNSSYSILAIGYMSVLASCGGSADEPENTAAEPKTYEEVEKAGWLLGNWRNNSEEGNMSESWMLANDSTMMGETYFVIGADTVFSETIELQQRGNKLFYTATIPTENDGKPVAFELTSSAKRSLVFENPAHDYPQKITYSLSNDSIVAEISGTKEGKMAQERFAMGKEE